MEPNESTYSLENFDKPIHNLEYLDKILDRWGYPNQPCDQCRPGERNRLVWVNPCPGEDGCYLHLA